MAIYYMDKGILLATIRIHMSLHVYIQDTSGVFSMSHFINCGHNREWYIDKFPPFLLGLCKERKQKRPNPEMTETKFPSNIA